MHDTSHDKHRGYTPIPLRWWYLSSVLGYIILLLAILEYSFHVVPQTNGRQTTPPTHFRVPPGSGPFKGDVYKPPISPEARRSIIRRNTTNGFNTTSPFPSNSTTTANPCDLDLLESLSTSNNPTNQTFHPNETCTVTTADPHEPSTFRMLHLSPSQFASLEPRTYLAHYRLHFIWVHDVTGRLYIPVFPGMDISTRCTAYGQYQYITNNPDDCRMLVEVDDFGIPGFQPLFEYGDRCYKEWYTFTEQYAGQWGWQPDISGNDWDKSKCWEDEWDAGRIIEYPKRVVSWPAGWPTDGAGNGVVGDMPAPTKTTVTSTLPPTMSLVTSTGIGADGKPTTSVFTTAVPGRVITTVMDVMPTPTASITVDGTVLTLTNSLGQPTATITSLLTSGIAGIAAPTATPYISFSTTILTDSQGRPTATSVIPVTITPTNSAGVTIRTISDQFGDAIATSTGYIVPLSPHPSPAANLPIPPDDLFSPGGGGGIGTGAGGGTINPNDIPSQAIQVQPLTWQSYFAGSFLPVLLTTILSILIQILNGSLRAMVPFLALSRSRAYHGPADRNGDRPSASESMLLPLEGNMFRLDTAVLLAWRHKEPLLLMSNVLQIVGMVLASLSSEAIGMTLGGGCRDDSFEGCFMSLAVVTGPARAAEGLLVGMALLLLAIMVGIWFLSRKRKRAEGGNGNAYGGLLTTPGGGNPTSLIGAAAMIAGEESKSLRDLLGGSGRGDREVERISDKEIRDRLDGHEFAVNSHGQVILATQDSSSSERGKTFTGLTATSSFSISSSNITGTKRRITDLIENKYDTFTLEHPNVVLLMEYGYRALFLAALGTLLFIVAYYGSAEHGEDDLIEQLMNSQTFGVSFLFTGAGGMIDFFWGGFFSSKFHEPLSLTMCSQMRSGD